MGYMDCDGLYSNDTGIEHHYRMLSSVQTIPRQSPVIGNESGWHKLREQTQDLRGNFLQSVAGLSH